MINTPIIDSRIITLDKIICTNIDSISAEERDFITKYFSAVKKISRTC